MILTKPEKLSELLTGKSLTFELGFGNGDFLLYLTREYQDHLVIGAEVANHYFLLAFRKLVRSGVNNFLLYRGDGRTLFRFFVPNGCVDSIYINFPDPWEKASKENRRLVSEASIKMYYSRLKTGGKIFVSTDSEVLKEYLRERLSANSIFFEETKENPFCNISTKYEKKWLSLNKPVSYFIIRKTDERNFDAPEVYFKEMPNFIFKLKNSEDNLLEKIRALLPIEFKEGDFYYKVDRVYFGDEDFLLRVIHSEPFLQQKYYILLKVREGKASLEIDDKNGILITKWVLKAVRDFAKRLYKLLGEEIIFSNLGEDFE